MDHNAFCNSGVLMETTIFNIQIGKYSCKTTKLPAPNESFYLTQSNINYLNKVPGADNWWKSYLYQICNGKMCFGLSDIHKRALEKIGLTVTVP
jgi:hypothetical protein